MASFLHKQHFLVAGALLALMFGLSITSAKDNSATLDELAHIPSGYSYLRYADYRLNPEHPPLIKDLAGLPLLFMNLHFPEDQTGWNSPTNGQWEAGQRFLYESGNDADAIIFWSRLSLLLLAVFFGAFFYWLVRQEFGTSTALLALFFYALSPNFIAHSTLVTTDVGAAIFMFIAIWVYSRFAAQPSTRNCLLLSCALAAAQLVKFSSFLLYPFLGVASLVLVWRMRSQLGLKDAIKLYVGGFVGASALSVALIYIAYVPHVWNMPSSFQNRLLDSANINLFHDAVFLKPILHYVIGLVMAVARVGGGSITYLNGAITNQSFRYYFPELFVLKTQLAFLVLMMAGGVFTLWRVASTRRERVLEWLLASFAIFYFTVAVTGNLNLGLRHILPVYLPIFVMTALAIVKIFQSLVETKWRWASAISVTALLLWYAGSTLAAHPFYIPYSNELMGGPNNADLYFSDSNADWGQDLRRLKTYVDAHPEITNLGIDYFGGGSLKYYFTDKKFVPWSARFGRYTGQYLAVSETLLTTNQFYVDRYKWQSYDYLLKQKPVAKIGYSIHLYKLY
jgi:hypothetical protein